MMVVTVKTIISSVTLLMFYPG